MQIDSKEKTNPMSDEFFNITENNIKKLRNRYNKIRRWVIADFLKRNAYRYPEKLKRYSNTDSSIPEILDSLTMIDIFG